MPDADGLFQCAFCGKKLRKSAWFVHRRAGGRACYRVRTKRPRLEVLDEEEEAEEQPRSRPRIELEPGESGSPDCGGGAEFDADVPAIAPSRRQ